MLRSTASDAKERPQRQSPGIKPGEAYDETGQLAGAGGATSNNKLNALRQQAPLRARSSNTLRGLGLLGVTLT